MNGDYYPLSPTPNAKNVSAYPVKYREYPGGVMYTEVYSPPIVSMYSQVFWTRLPSVPLAKDFVDQYDGRDVAIVGFEMDQVFRTPNGDVSVPLTCAYNHHFESNMLGANSRLEEVDSTDPRVHITGHQMAKGGKVAIPVELKRPSTGTPSSQSFGAANGGEYRLSYHGYAPGYAQVIHSPQQMSITPMQIDTWNRDEMNCHEPNPKFVPGPEPRTSLAPKDIKDHIYSGLLECPLTTRIKKNTGATYATQTSGTCSHGIVTASECFVAATKVGLTLNFTDTAGMNSQAPNGCSIQVSSDGKSGVAYFNELANSSVECAAGAKELVGTASSLVTVSVALNVSTQYATITMVGPSDVWFGVGFNAQEMKDAPWAIIVDGTGNVTERKLADQSPGTQLDSSVTVQSSSVNAGVRTVVMTRPMKGKSSDYYTFSASGGTLNFINALGSGPTLAYHKSKTASSMLVLPTNTHVCVCEPNPKPFGEATGSLEYTDGTSVGCCNHCQPEPRTDMLAQKNPTCDIRTYVGGQIACHHLWSLLDADQEIPWQDQKLNYSIKFRFWYQDYVPATPTKPASHQSVSRTTWGIASPVEYDVPKCQPGMIGCDCEKDQCIHTIKGTFTVGGTSKIVAAHFHCHAPTCLSVALYNNDTGDLICVERPIYGGTGEVQTPKFDEPGYILQPPCLWGEEQYGLEPPVLVGGTTLHAVKTSNATFGHHGEMAWMQVFLID